MMEIAVHMSKFGDDCFLLLALENWPKKDVFACQNCYGDWIRLYIGTMVGLVGPYMHMQGF